MSYILVTGANGYIGNALGGQLASSGYRVRGAARASSAQEISGYHELSVIGDVGSETDWSEALKGVQCVIHLAARAHRLKESTVGGEALYREVNCYGTLNLARQAARCGVKRLIYLSSIGVLGDRSGDSPFTNDSLYAPKTFYAQSKMEAEIGLEAIAADSDMEIVIVRPPLVYGEGAPGNFLRLLKLVKLGVPLPFGALHSKKSMIYLGNLLDFIVKCVEAPEAVNRKWVITDGSSWSTTELIQLIARYMEKRVVLLPVPPFLLRTLGAMVGESKAIEKLSSPLRVDGIETVKVLDWKAPYTPEHGLRRSVEYFTSTRV